MRVPSDTDDWRPAGPTAPVPSAPKKLVLAEKPPPFSNSRTLLAACLLAVITLSGYAFIRWYVDTVRSLDITANKVSAQRVAAVKSLASPNRPPRKEPTTGAAMSPSSGTPGAAALAPSRIVAPATQKIGTVVVGVAEAKLMADGGQTSQEYLRITLRITNLSSEPMAYVSWSEPTLNPVLTDQYHNYYNRLDTTTEPGQGIPPNRTIIDTLRFEKPLPGAVLALDLPMGNQKFEFSLPAIFIQRLQIGIFGATVAPPAPAQKMAAPPAAAAAEAPYSAERDPQLIADIKATYREAMQRVETRALGMNTNNGIRFRKTERETIVKKIATKLDMTVEQIERMISSH
jgi:hypothetical protein